MQDKPSPQSSTSNVVSIFKSRSVHCFYEDAGSSTLLVTFNPMTMRVSGNAFWADGFARKSGYSVIGIVSTGPNWFPEICMEHAIAACQPIIDQYETVIAYGGSMGGYGALKFGDNLRAKSVVAFSPQYSIDPERTGSSDSRYHHFFDPEIHSNNAICPVDMTAVVDRYVFYDPGHPQDAFSVETIANQGAVHKIAVPFMGHGTIQCFAGTDRASQLLKLAAAGKTSDIRLLTHRLRTNHQIRKHLLACAAVARRPTTAFRIYEEDPTILSAARADDFAKACARGRRVGEATNWAEQSLRVNYSSAMLWLLSKLQVAAGDFDGGTSTLLRAFENEPSYSTAIEIGKVALRAQNYIDASRWARSAIAINTRAAQAYRLLSLVEERSGDLHAARETIRSAKLLFPKNGTLQMDDERLSLLLAD